MTALVVVLAPLVAAPIAVLLKKNYQHSAIVVLLGSLAALLAGLVEWITKPTEVIDTLGPIPVPGLELPLRLFNEQVAGLTATVVALVLLMVQVFAHWYLADDDRYPVFAASVSLFGAAMLLVVQSADLILTLIGWEVMGWCSYQLIGHFSRKASARRAAYKAFMVTRFADVGMVLGFGWLIAETGSSDLGAIWAYAITGQGRAPLTLAVLGILMGIAGKSGLFPFHDWLPDAMEGPTPASALIHAATMVAAGTFLLFRFLPLYAVDDAVRLVIAVLAAVTMIWAAILAFGQSDIKRLLAYSTLSQVAIMASATATTATDAGLQHLWSHAFFKALLFLAAGWLSVLAGGTAFAVVRGGLAKDTVLKWCTAAGLLSLAGVPPLVGFFSKDAVVTVAEESALHGGGAPAWIVFVALLITVALTAAYCARAWLLLNTGEPSEAGEGHHEVHSSTGAMVPVVVLAAATVLGGLLLWAAPGGLHLGPVSAIVSVALVLIVGVLVWVASKAGRRDLADRLGERGKARFANGFGMDAVYVGFGSAIMRLATLTAFLDKEVVDAYPRGAALGVRTLSRLGDKGHRAVASTGLVGVVLGVVTLAVLGVTLWH